MARGRGARYRRSKDVLPTKEFRFSAEGAPSRRDTLIVAQPRKSFRAGLAFLKSYPSRPVRHLVRRSLNFRLRRSLLESRDPGLGSSEDQGMNVLGSFIGIHRKQVH